MHRIFTMSRWLNRVDIWYIRMKGYKPYTKPSTWAGTNTINKPVSSFHTTSLYSYYKKLAKNWITSQGNYFLFTAPSNTAPSILRHAVIHHLVCTLLAPFLPCRVQQFLNILCIVLSWWCFQNIIKLLQIYLISKESTKSHAMRSLDRY